jgi:hypothetical protein
MFDILLCYTVYAKKMVIAYNLWWQQVAAQSGHQVTLAEINEGALQKAKASIETNLKRVAKKVHKVRCWFSYLWNKTNS